MGGLSGHSLSMSDGLVLQDLSGHNSSCHEDAIPLQNLEIAHRGSRNNLQSGSKFTSETLLLEDPVSASSYSSGAGEIQKTMKSDTKRPTLSPTAKSITEGLVKIGKSRAKVEKSQSYDCLYDSSSGNDSPNKASKARSLRKTKSRGKGKGRSRLTVEGLDDLGIDNRGYYTSESDEENKESAQGSKVKRKQCWI